VTYSSTSPAMNRTVTLDQILQAQGIDLREACLAVQRLEKRAIMDLLSMAK
jgi:hypothetical protein